MPVLIISFKDDSERRLAAAFQAKGASILSVLTGKLTALMFQLQSYIVTTKLSGQVLRRRSGTLAGSVTAIPATFEGTQIVAGVDVDETHRAGVEAAAGPAFYGAVQELGGSAPYTIMAVKARALAFMVDGKQVFAKSVAHPALVPRPFMSTSLSEKAEQIRAEMKAALEGQL